MRSRKQTWKILLLLGLMMLVPVRVLAQSSSSPNYRVDQTFFGSGGETNASSSSFKARQSAGELSIGNTKSASFQAWAGFNTTDEPYLEMNVAGGTLDLGVLVPGTAVTGSSTFYVRAWQASGYVVQTQSDPPKNGNYTLPALTTPTASNTTQEQFGINLVANTSPNTVGEIPQQSPDGTFSFGAAAGGYNTADLYKYVKGDVIAESTQSTSVTVYTISYLFNIKETTPAGEFRFVHNLVAVGTY
jgi:hypothetical protein